MMVVKLNMDPQGITDYDEALYHTRVQCCTCRDWLKLEPEYPCEKLLTARTTPNLDYVPADQGTLF